MVDKHVGESDRGNERRDEAATDRPLERIDKLFTLRAAPACDRTGVTAVRGEPHSGPVEEISREGRRVIQQMRHDVTHPPPGTQRGRFPLVAGQRTEEGNEVGALISDKLSDAHARSVRAQTWPIGMCRIRLALVVTVPVRDRASYRVPVPRADIRLPAAARGAASTRNAQTRRG